MRYMSLSCYCASREESGSSQLVTPINQSMLSMALIPNSLKA